MKKFFTILTLAICLQGFGQHKTYRTDVFDFSKYKWYYAGIDEDFMSRHNLLPGDTVAIKDNVDSIYNIHLGNASLHGITFINDTANTRQIPIGYFALGPKCYDVKFLGNGSKHVQGNGFKLYDKTHFGLSWTCAGDLEAAYLDFDGCLIGIQLYTKPGIDYPVNYQNFHAHHIRMKHISNESFYLGYVKDVPILMNLNLHDIEIDSSGWDGIQTRNTNSVRIRNCRLNGIGLSNHYGDQHAILLYNNKDSAIIKNVTVRNCKGIGIFNSGFGDFLIENNDIEADGQAIYNRAYNTTGKGNADIENIGYQNMILKCNRFRSGKGVIVQYLTDTSLHKKVRLTAINNNCKGLFNASKDVKIKLEKNSPAIKPCKDYSSN